MNTASIRNRVSAAAILCFGLAGCAGTTLTNVLNDAGQIVGFINQPSTQAAIAAVEATGQKFVCVAASAQAAVSAEEKANGAGNSIQSDGQLFYFGSSIGCALLGGSVTQVAAASTTPTASAKAVMTSRGLRYYRREKVAAR